MFYTRFSLTDSLYETLFQGWQGPGTRSSIRFGRSEKFTNLPSIFSFHLCRRGFETEFYSWPFQLLLCSPSTTGLALPFTLVCHNSDDLFEALIVKFEAFSIIIELSHNFLWEISQIFCFDKARPHLGAFLY